MGKTTYLVTGGAGFIGSNFVLHILAAHPEAEVVNLDALTYAGNLENLDAVAADARYHFVHADICDDKALRHVFSEFDPTYVVNFAAESHVDRSIDDPDIFERTNVSGTLTLLDVASDVWEGDECDYGDHRFLQVSTDEVYGSLELGDDGAFFREDMPLSPHSPYSASKASADMFARAFGDTFGIPVLITRCSNNYGPFQFPEKLIPLLIRNCLAHKPLPIYGDGLNVRDWLYVADHCKAIDLVLRRGRVGEVYNVGGHNERSNLQIARKVIELVAERTGDAAINDSLITFVADRKGHDRRYAIAPDKIEAELGWRPETPFDEGIVATVDWYLGHREWVESVTSGAYQDYYREHYGEA